MRLYCPNGEVVEYGSADATGRLFQFKVGVVRGNGSRETLAQVVGMLNGLETGQCAFTAWEYDHGALRHGIDNVLEMVYHQTGRLSGEVLGFRV